MYTCVLTVSYGEGPVIPAALSFYDTTSSVPHLLHRYEERMRRPGDGAVPDPLTVMGELHLFLARANDSWLGVSPLASSEDLGKAGPAGRDGSDMGQPPQGSSDE